MSYSVGQVSGVSSMNAMSGASAQMPPSPKMAALFDRIDSSGQGSIDKSQLQSAFQTQNPPKVFQNLGADALYKQLDPGGTGSVSKAQFVQKMSSLMSSLRNSSVSTSDGAASVSASSTLSASAQLLSGAGSTFDISA